MEEPEAEALLMLLLVRSRMPMASDLKTRQIPHVIPNPDQNPI
jgi:hypothetical protein